MWTTLFRIVVAATVLTLCAWASLTLTSMTAGAASVRGRSSAAERLTRDDGGGGTIFTDFGMFADDDQDGADQGGASSGERPNDRQDALTSSGKNNAVDSIRVTPVVRAVQKAGPSVLNIQVGDIVRTPQGPAFRKLGEGSGVIVSEEGLVLTNWHVVRFKEQLRDAFQCRVKLRDERQFPARVINTSRANDLALLLITPENDSTQRFPPIEMGDSESLMIGETVIAIGNPRGQVNSVTTGVLSAVGRSLAVKPPGERQPIHFDTLLQHDAAINPGNSGGGLLDLTGKLIGINTLMQVESQNINFAIPVDHVRKVFDQDLLNVSRLAVWFGIDTAERGGRFVVTRVVPGSPAARAGLQVGDAIDQVGERKTLDSKSYAKALVTYRVGQRVPLLIQRGEASEWKSIDAWSRSKGTILEAGGLVVELVDVVKERNIYRSVLGDLLEAYRFTGGNFDVLRVIEVEENGPAAKFGLREGDFIVGYIVSRGASESWPPPAGAAPRRAPRWRVSEEGRPPRLSVWRATDGLLSGRMRVRKR